MAEALRLVLIDDRRPPVTTDRAETLGDVDLALRLERADQRVVGAEVRLDRRLVAAAHHDDVIDPGAERLVDHDLQRRLVADREQFLRNGLGGGEETSAHSGCGNDGTAHLHETDAIFSTPMPTYVYKFVDTGETIEVQQAFTDATLTEFAHPDSGEVLAVKKVFTPVGVTFKGSGFFKTDNRGKKSASETGSKKDGDSKSDSKFRFESIDVRLEIRIEVVRLEIVRRVDEEVDEQQRPTRKKSNSGVDHSDEVGHTDVELMLIPLADSASSLGAEIGVFGGSGFYEFLDDPIDVELTHTVRRTVVDDQRRHARRAAGRLPRPPRPPPRVRRTSDPVPGERVGDGVARRPLGDRTVFGRVAAARRSTPASSWSSTN